MFLFYRNHLPFFRSELAAHFTTLGAVSHCVILATVDSASRRRGFVVMSTHDEARRALTSLSGTKIGWVFPVYIWPELINVPI